MTTFKPFFLALALATTSLVSADRAVASGALQLTESQLDAVTAGGIVVDAAATAEAFGIGGGFAFTSTDTSATSTQGTGQAESLASADLAASSTSGALGGIDGGPSGPDLLVVTGGSADAIGSDATTRTQSRVFVHDGRIVDVGVAGSVSTATGLVTDADAFADGAASGDIVIERRLAGTRGGPNSDVAFARVVVISITPPKR